MKTKQFLYAASLFLLAACSADDSRQQESGRVPVLLSYTTLQATDTRAAAQQGLNDANIESGQEVHVQIANVGSTSWEGYTYTTGESGAMSAPTSPSTPLYPTDDTHIKILAWYPSDAAENGFEVQADQSSDAGYQASDLMFSNNITDQAKQIAPVELQFVHKMAKIVVNVTSGVGVSAIQAVTLKNVHRTLSLFDHGDGTVMTKTSDGVSDVTIVKEGTDATAAGAALIPDQTINGALLEITTDLGTATYSVASKHFESGHKYTLNISVSRTTVNTTTAIGAWDADGSVTINSQGSPFMTFTVGGATFRMVYVEGGDFSMTYGNYNSSNSAAPNNVTVTGSLSDYYIGQTEVTNALWSAVMGSKPNVWSASGQNNGQPNNGNTYPVAYVSWEDICTATTGFLDKLNAAVASQLPTGMKFYLPTEAQWEYAARGGKYSNGYTYSGTTATVGDVAWYTSNSSTTTHPVASKPANELGLYDMSGNVWEWCEDWYADVAANQNLGLNYVNATTASSRVSRGGSWYNTAVGCTVSFRDSYTPTYRNCSIGFRLALRPSPAQ